MWAWLFLNFSEEISLKFQRMYFFINLFNQPLQELYINILNFRSIGLNTADGLTHPEGSQVEDILTSQRLGNLTPQAPQKPTPGMQVHNCLKRRKLPNR